MWITFKEDVKDAEGRVLYGAGDQHQCSVTVGARLVKEGKAVAGQQAITKPRRFKDTIKRTNMDSRHMELKGGDDGKGDC